jgi:hypothetical protein
MRESRLAHAWLGLVWQYWSETGLNLRPVRRVASGLQRMNHLHTLNLSSTNITGAALRRLATCPRLSAIYLRCCDALTGDCLAALDTWPALEVVDITGSHRVCGRTQHWAPVSMRTAADRLPPNRPARAGHGRSASGPRGDTDAKERADVVGCDKQRGHGLAAPEARPGRAVRRAAPQQGKPQARHIARPANLGPVSLA